MTSKVPSRPNYFMILRWLREFGHGDSPFDVQSSSTFPADSSLDFWHFAECGGTAILIS